MKQSTWYYLFALVSAIAGMFAPVSQQIDWTVIWGFIFLAAVISEVHDQ